jgi:3-hydroxyacyl-[acyl-carrier-protein] dehydratase
VRETREDDWYFQGHFPDQPVVPAVVLVELIAQTGGLAAGAGASAPIALRVAALGPFKFPAAAGSGVRLEATARVVGKFGGLFRIEGEVRAGDVVVAAGSVTLAQAPQL